MYVRLLCVISAHIILTIKPIQAIEHDSTAFVWNYFLSFEIRVPKQLKLLLIVTLTHAQPHQHTHCRISNCSNYITPFSFIH